MKQIIKHGFRIAAYTIGFLCIFYATFTHAMRYDHRPHPPGWRQSLLHASETIAYGGFLKPARWLSGAGHPIVGPGKALRGPAQNVHPIVFVPVFALAYGIAIHLFAVSLMKFRASRNRNEHAAQPGV